MRARATLETREGEALALRMRKHFGHKVPVEQVGRVSRIQIPAGELELEPRDGTLEVRALAADAVALARVQEVAGSHLDRFAREGTGELRWTRDSLEERALAWIAPHRNARHLARARDWVRELRPDAGEALVLAALLHDVDRNVDARALDRHVAAWDDADVVRAHAERAAEVAAGWLRSEGAPEALVREVADLIRLHEVGGGEEADVLQAADSLSFLETNPAERWVRERRVSAEEALRKLEWMHDRIRERRARELARPLLERASADVVSAGSVSHDRARSGGALRQSNEGRAHGNKR